MTLANSTDGKSGLATFDAELIHDGLLALSYSLGHLGWPNGEVEEQPWNELSHQVQWLIAAIPVNIALLCTTAEIRGGLREMRSALIRFHKHFGIGESDSFRYAAAAGLDRWLSSLEGKVKRLVWMLAPPLAHAAEVESSKPAVPNQDDADDMKLKALGRALAMLAEYRGTDISVAKLAKAAECSPQYLYRDPTFSASWKVHRELRKSRSRIIRGSKAKDGTLEAIQENSDGG